MTPRCVVLGHDTRSAPGLGDAIVAGRAVVVAVVDRWVALLDEVVHADPEVVIVDLAAVDQPGVRLIAALRALSPRCQIIVLSPSPAIDLAAVEAGAALVVDPDDLRPLTAALLEPRVRAQV